MVNSKLAEVNHIINVDSLAFGWVAPSGAASGSSVSSEASVGTPPAVPPAVPLVTGGKYTP